MVIAKPAAPKSLEHDFLYISEKILGASKR